MVLMSGDSKLLDKFNLSLSCLDYSFIEKCQNVKELEKILRVLRSEEEGSYPDLTKFCESRLRELNPDNKLLEVEKRVTSISDLSSRERQILDKELMDWENQMKQCQAVAASSQNVQRKLPPVRNSGEIKQDVGKEAKSKPKPLSGNKFKVKQKSYSEWDKFDVEKELSRVHSDKTCSKEAAISNKNEPLSGLQPFIDTSGLSDKEKVAIAEKEKMKGNESFKVQEYEEAELYYSRSISAFPTVAALNNRAFTNFKLKEYTAALADLNTVLQLEPTNVKAMYRRGLVYKETGRFQLAYMDFTNALEMEPGNKAAKEQLAEMDKNPCCLPKDSKSVTIEEISSTETRAAKANSSKFPGLAPKREGNKQLDLAPTNTKKVSASEKTSLERLPPQTVSFLKVCDKEKSPERSNEDIFEEVPKDKTRKTNRKEVLVNIKSADDDILKEVPKDKVRKVESQEKEVLVDIKPIVNVLEPSFTEEDKKNSCLLLSGPKDKVNSADSSSMSLDSSGKGDTAAPKPIQQIKKDNAVKLPSLKTNLERLNEKMTPFKFFSLWHSMEANHCKETAATILLKIKPDELPSLISTKLDSDIFIGIIQGITGIVSNGDVEIAYNLLLHLLEVPRVHIVLSFLSSEEQKGVRDLITSIQNAGVEDKLNLEQKFDVYF